MKLELVLLLLAVAVCVHGLSSGNRSGYDCRRQCGYGRRYVCSTDGNTYDNECMMKCNWAYKSCDGRCPCYRPPPPKPIVVKTRPVVNYKPRQPVNSYKQRQPVNNYKPRQPVNYEPRQPASNYEPSQPVNNYESSQSVNSYEPRQPVNYFEPSQPINYYEPIQPVDNYIASPDVNYQSPPDIDPISEPTPVYYDAPVQGDCVCSKDKDYVCTYDGETYDNECEANCDGKAKMCDGQCPCS